MAITVVFHSFSKRENSTKRPTTAGVEFDCEIKADCGILHPAISLIIAGENPPLYNYAYIAAFERYYFIDEWTYNAGIWTASLSVDALATWKTEIGASNQYVLRSSYEYDGSILDSFYPTKGGAAQIDYESVSDPFCSDLAGGRYVVGIINGDAAAVGAVAYYVFSQGQFNSLMDTLMSDTAWLNVDPANLTQDVLRAVYNPFQYIVSCTWFPFIVPSVGPIETLPYGWWELNVTCNRLSTVSQISTMNISVSKQNHPYALERGMYLNLEPFSRYILDCKPFGLIPLDSTLIDEISDIYLEIKTDCITGAGQLTILSDLSNHVTMGIYPGQIGVNIQLAQIARDYLATASAAVSAVGNVVSNAMSLNIGGAIASAATGIESTIKAATPQLQSSGVNGSLLAFSGKPKLICRFYTPVEDDNDNQGRPLCKVRQISAVPGYITCLSPDIALPSTSNENSTIKGYMEAGFFYE